MKHRARWYVLGMVTTLLALAAPVYAGNRLRPTTVVVVNSNGSGRAAGSLAAARASTDAGQYIGCEIRINSQGVRTATCMARNAAGVSIDCETDLEPMIETIQSLGTHSYLWFYADSTGECTSMTFRQSSQYGF
jgi:hypothetical protein